MIQKLIADQPPSEPAEIDAAVFLRIIAEAYRPRIEVAHIHLFLRRVEPLRRELFLPLAADIPQVTRPLGIENQLLGYVYLVDENCKIRWAGCATAESGEAESLRKATAVLMKRLRAEKDGK